MALLLLAGSPATQAQSYGSPTYSGGSTSVACGGSHTSTPYSLGSWTAQATNMSQVYGWGGSGYTYAYNSQVGSVTCSGPVTATFNWNGGAANAPLPQGVIVQENCTAAWSVEDPQYGSGSCTSSFGAGSETQTGNMYNGEVVGVRYSYQANPPATLTVPLPGVQAASPQATASATTPSDCAVSAALAYTASATPVYLNLTGTTLDANKKDNILVGQGCTASLSGIPSGPGWQTSYAWSISGSTFQSWNGDSGTIPVVAVLGPGRTDQPTAHWYWTDNAAPETVTCTATVTAPSGQGSPFTVTVTKPVNLQRPTFNATNDGGLGYITQGTIYALQAGPTPFMRNYNFQEGSSWRTTMSIPPPFAGSGQFGYAQIIKPGEYLTGDDGIEHGSSDNGQQELDSQFPYLGNSYSADGSAYNEGDSPGIPFNTAFTSPDLIASARLADVFQTYLMFKPSAGPGAPSSDAQWVPLAESDWHTDMGAGRPASGRWSDFPTTQAAGDVYIDSNFTPQTIHPYWTQVSGH